MILAALAFAAAFARADGADPSFAIKTPARTVEFKRSELAQRPDLATLTIDYDPTFPGRTMTYHAVPIHDLFSGLDIPAGATLQFKCLDGYSAPIDRDRLLNADESKSVAYLAVELADEKWPAVAAGGGTRTPAPFYVIWKNPKASNIGPEEWPYQLAAFEVRPAVEQAFPAIFPDPKLPRTDAAWKGARVFAKNCFTCHTMNLAGESLMGPDLNVPMSPTEYLTPKALKLLIRNPANLRHWPQAKMTPFDSAAIPERELDDLVAYLKYMAKHRKH